MRTGIIDRRQAWRVSLALGLILIVVVALFTNGGTHGLSADDYVYKLSQCEFSATTGRLEIELAAHRVIGNALDSCLTKLLPEYEIWLRVGIVVVHLLNVLLLAWLAERVTGSRLVALLSGLFFLAPLQANEGILWFVGSISNTLPLLLLLIGMHLALAYRTFPGQYLSVAGAIIVWIIMALFIESGFFVLILLPLFIWMMKRRGLPVRARAWVPVLVLSYLFIGGYSFFVLRTTPIISLHGDTTFDPVYILLRRIPETLDSAFSFLSQWQASGPLFQAMQLGLYEWSRDVGILLLIAMGLALALAAVLYPSDETHTPAANNYLILTGAGLAWFALALAPVLFFVNLTVSSRVLLFPSAGLALAMAGLFGWLVGRFGRWQFVAARLILLGALLGLAVNSLGMAGITRVYQLRWELDQKQVRMLRAGMPQLPSQVWLLPLTLNNRSVSAYWKRDTVLDNYLYGLFQIPWAAMPALEMEYSQSGIYMVDRDMQGHVHLTGLEQDPNGAVSHLVFEGTISENRVAVDQLVAFTFRQDHLVLLNPLVITGSSGRVEVDLPLAMGAPNAASQPWELAVEPNK